MRSDKSLDRSVRQLKHVEPRFEMINPRKPYFVGMGKQLSAISDSGSVWMSRKTQQKSKPAVFVLQEPPQD